jgi:ribosomal protein L29
MITKDELKKLDRVALENEAKSLKKEYFNLKLGMITGQVKDTAQFEKIRKQVARMLTFARAKQQPAKPQAKV